MKPFEAIPYATREEWLEIRKSGIGGSEAAACLGRSKYKSPYSIYISKAYGIDSFEETRRVRQGKMMEGFIASEFSLEKSLPVFENQVVLRSVVYPWMLASLDRVGVDENNVPFVLECKNVASSRNSEWEGENGEELLPPDALYQVLHYLAVTGYSYAWVAAAIGEYNIVYRKVIRDENLIATIIEAEREMWDRIQRKDPPEMDGSESTTKTLDYVLAQEVSGKEVSFQAQQGLLAQLENVNEQIDLLETTRNSIRNLLKAEIGDAELAIVIDEFGRPWKATFKEQSTTTLDSVRLKKECPDVWAKYSRTSKSRVLRITSPSKNTQVAWEKMKLLQQDTNIGGSHETQK